jgi:hypothetical protein
MKELNEPEVRRRLALCKDAGVMHELYEMGGTLVRDAEERLHRIDDKAGKLAAYCGGLVTIVTSTSSLWFSSSGFWERLFTALGATLAASAVVLAVHTMRLQTVQWYSEDDWLNIDCLDKEHKIKKFRVLTMWAIISSHDSVYRQKTSHITRVEYLTVGAIAVLFIALLLFLARRAFL